jgi:uncharacterized protein (TIGR03437 family)
MKFVAVPVFALYVAALALPASASVASFATTNQNVMLTGLGSNGAGQGQDRVTWGSCVFSGGNTVCTVTASFTGFGGGGTIAWVLTYQGNGPSPLTTGSQVPGGDQLVPFSLSSGSFNTTITENNGTILNFYGQAPYFTYNQTQCTGVSMCSPGSVGLTVGSTITGTVSGTFDTTPIIRGSLGVISASAFGSFTSIAPGTWIEIYGTNLATTLAHTWGGSDFNGNNAPTALAGTTVTVGGQPAYIDYASPSQLNAQVPSGIATGRVPVVVTTGGGTSVAYTIQVNPVQPGLLAPSVFQINGTQYVVALFPDGITYVLPPGVTNAVPTRRAKPGDTIILYGVGFGPVEPNISAGQIVQQLNALPSFQVSFAGTPARVTYAGLTLSYVGLYQFNVVVPNVAASDTVPLTFSVGTTGGTQTVVIPISN